MEETQSFIEKQRLINIKELNELPDVTAQSACWSKRSIYKIPASVTDLNKRAYKPQIVSIGPYHNDTEYLMEMEEHKERALRHFLKRSRECQHTLVEALTPVIQDLKDAYGQLDPKWHKDGNKFLEMIIRDGCFILELLRATNKQRSEGADQSSNDQDYAFNDPIFSNHGKLYIVPYLKRDMLMLENQIPMLALEKLASVQNDASLKKCNELIKLILEFFSPAVSTSNYQQFKKCLHILDVYRESLLTAINNGSQVKDGKRPSDNQQDGDEIIRSATELNEAGIVIKKSETKSLKDISFKKGVLRLPLIVVDDALESLYLNLIAFERFHFEAGNEVTSYIFFIDNIIDNERDVRLLHSCGIIQNALGSDQEVANLFNSLSKDITLDPDSSLDKVHKEVRRYCQKRWHRYRANLKHTYFTNPWASLSLVAAIFLFALTILQTVYSVLAYVKPPPN